MENRVRKRIAGARGGVSGFARPAGASGKVGRAGGTALVCVAVLATVANIEAITVCGYEVCEKEDACPDLSRESSKGEWLMWRARTVFETEDCGFRELM